MSATQELTIIIQTTAIIPILAGMQEVHYVIYSGVRTTIQAVHPATPAAVVIPAAILVHQAVAAAVVVVVPMRQYENFKIIQKRPTHQVVFSSHTLGPLPEPRGQDSVSRQVSHSYSTYFDLNS